MTDAQQPADDRSADALPLDAVAPSLPNRRTGKKREKADGTAAAERTKFESYEIVEIHRSEIKNAPYNPRRISDKARKRIKDKIAKIGLVTPITWNRRTGHIVGGHQRMSVLDSLEGTKNYYVRVAAVDMDEKTEKETNVFLNNEQAQGEYDMEALEKLFKEDKIDHDEAGYDLAELCTMFGDNPIVEQPEQLLEISEKIRAAREQYEEIIAKSADKDEMDYYLVVVFKGDDDRLQFTETVGFPDERFVDGRRLWEFLEENRIIEGEETEAEAEGKAILSINSCARCGEDHAEVIFYPLLNPPDAATTHWGNCPKTQQPILMYYKSDSEADSESLSDPSVSAQGD